MTSRSLRAAALLAALFLFAAFVPGAAGAQGAPRVVVAVIDSTMNPYHEFFHAGGSLYGGSAPSSVTPEVLAELGVPDTNIIHLTRTGNFAADFAADKAEFDAIRPGEPYWFAGTNVIGISFRGADGTRLRPEGPGNAPTSHGMGTTSAVLAANPEAVVVLVESGSLPLTDPAGVTGFGTQPVGEAWAFNHPAVDIITTSYGPPGSPPLGYHLTDSYRGVVTNGKLHFGAADNSPALSPFDATSGPWWSIGIAGYHEGSGEARERQSGSFPDFVGDFTQTLPYCLSCEEGTRAVSGTSFATPRSAGTMSKIVLELRRATGHVGGIATESPRLPSLVRAGGIDVTNWEVRRALEVAAYVPPTAQVSDAPYLEFSWGAITPDAEKRVVAEALGHFGFGAPKRSKNTETCVFMTANIEARQAWWSSHPRSQGFGQPSDDYLPC